MKKKTLMIIGSNGFFGSSLISYIEKKKSYQNLFNKIILVNKSKTKNKISKQLRNKIIFKKIEINLLELKTLPKVDYIFYFALLKNLRKDTEALNNLCDVILRKQIKPSIVYASSGAVYGKSNKRSNFLESLNLKKKNIKYDKEKKEYALTKIRNELILKKLSKTGIKIKIARCFTFVGKFLTRKNFIIVKIIEKILNKEKLDIKMKKKVYRSYMHSDDLSYFLLRLLFMNNSKFEVYNIGSDDKILIEKLIQLLENKNEIRQKLNKFKKKKIDYYVPNIFKLRKFLKFKKKLNSFNAVIKTIRQLKSIN